ncbi:MAG: molybdate ABC transporter permease subunit [Acetobacteraceae bacterium]|nr:molybdate ABC transporter permease subunit [Acetobacteraceae bacterium]
MVLTLSPAEWEAVRLSLLVASGALVLSVPLAIAAALLLNQSRFPGHSILDAVLHLPLVLPPVVTGWLLLLVFGVQGPLGRPLLAGLGIRLAFTTTGAALATAAMSFPLVLRAVRLSLDSLDPGLIAAARTLGAGRVDRLVTITLPLIAPGILAGAVTAFAAGLGEFGAVITFAANIPGETQTLPLAMYSAIQNPGGDATAARLAIVSFALAIILLVVAEASSRRLRVWLGR